MDQKQKVALTLALHRPGAPVRRETITQEIVKVGRDPKSHLRVDDELAARMHAVLEVASPDRITLIDLGNEPGTSVNGKRVNKCELAAGDVIGIGATRVVLERAELVAVAAPPALERNPFVERPAAPAPAGYGWDNPFAAAPVADQVSEDAPEGSYTYALVRSGPEVSEEECEVPTSSVEVLIRWGNSVLHVEHLTPPRSFYVGEEERKNLTCDFFLPADRLGATRAPVVLADGSGNVHLVLPGSATGTIEIPGQPAMSVAQARDGRSEPCAELAGARQIALPPRSKATIEIGDIVFQISTVNAGRVVASAFQLDTAAAPYHGLSALVHVGLLAAAALFMPPLGGTDADEIGAEQRYLMQQYLANAQAIQETPDEQRPDQTTGDTQKEGGTGKRSIGEEGKMGSTTSKDTNKRYAVESKLDLPPQLAKAMALRDAGEFGIIGIINAGAGGDPKAPTAPWGGLDSSGKDAVSALGNLWGADIGEAAGNGGLGLTGIGEGGGGNGLGVGLGSLGTIGHGNGLGDGQGFGNGDGGFGHGVGRLQPIHKTTVPNVRIGAVSVGGHLPPEVIQRIVRQNFGRFRFCYENGLRNNPNLAGRVGVRFVIGRDGSVSNVGNGGSDLPDSAVVSCVVRAFYGLSFPQPDEGGIVTVVYPIMFTPGG